MANRTRKSGLHEEFVSQLPSSEDMSMEAEEYPLLGAVTRQCLVKT